MTTLNTVSNVSFFINNAELSSIESLKELNLWIGDWSNFEDDQNTIYFKEENERVYHSIFLFNEGIRSKCRIPKSFYYNGALCSIVIENGFMVVKEA